MTVANRTKWLAGVLSLLAAGWLGVSAADAQRRNLPRNAPPRGGEEIVAVAGSPFGVGRMTIMPPPVEPGAAADDSPYVLTDKDDRTVYSVFATEPVRAILREALGVAINRSQRITVYFLFTGDQPLTLTLRGPSTITRTITPVSDRVAHDRLLADWWRERGQNLRSDHRENDYPQIVNNYVTSMLARRLNLRMPEPGRLLGILGSQILGTPRPGNGDNDETVGLVLGTESLRSAMLRRTMLEGEPPVEPLDQPLPVELAPPPTEFPEASQDVAIESIAMHVPHDCFYIRYGSFPNYTWLRSMLDEWGGDLRNLIALRGLDYGNSIRMERQLGLKDTVLSRVLGGTVIADVAMLGQDPFLREGAAIGIMFQARNNYLLNNNINQQRAEVLAREKNAKETQVDIDGRTVSFISTPDNAVRSFYAVDGDFHLVTTSRTVVRRFFEAGQGKRSLGQSKEFRYARSVMPQNRDDTVFAYISDEFLRNLMGPAYRVEMTRRLQAVTDIELLSLAQLAARAEGRPADTWEQMISAGVLPAGFGRRSDGSRPVMEGSLAYDSLRGGRGSFLPVPDVEIKGITRTEANAYREFSQTFRSTVERTNPIMAGIKRQPLDNNGRERIVLDVNVTPFARAHSGRLANYLGPATRTRVAPIQGDMISLELVTAGGLLGTQPGVQHVFAGVQDFNPQLEVRDGEVRLAGDFRGLLNGYIGGWPRPGLLQILGYRVDAPRDPNGLAQNPNDRLWQRSYGEFSILALRREILERVVPQLRIVEDERPAQARLHVADLSQSQLANFANVFAYSRSRKTSLGNARFLMSLITQLKAPPEQCLSIAETLLDARIVCPLGGDYQLKDRGDGFKEWVSSAWTSRSTRLDFNLPRDYSPPPMNWFRGVDLTAGMYDNALTAHMVLDVQRKIDPANPQPANPIPLQPADRPPVGELPAPR